jgi:NitT/TauT family transport system permease protein
MEITMETSDSRIAVIGPADPEPPQPSKSPQPLLPRIFVFRRQFGRVTSIAVSFGFSVTLLLFWELIVRIGWAKSVFFPAPSTIIITMVQMFVAGQMATNAGISIMRVLVAFGLSTIMAIPIGIFMGSYRIISLMLEPVIDFIRYLPVPALVPLSIIWFGIGEETKIFLLWLGTFFQLVLFVVDDMNRVPQEYVETANTLGANQVQMLKDVAFRSMLPSLVDNLRLTLGWCWTYLIIAEIVAANSGLGFVIWTARRYMQTPQVMAGVVLIGIIGLATDQGLRMLHRHMFRYLRP